jgi:hypothetical protein
MRFGRQHKGRCPETGKRRYKEQIDVMIDNAGNPRKMRAYKCPHCHDWHGSSTPDRMVPPRAAQ